MCRSIAAFLLSALAAAPALACGTKTSTGGLPEPKLASALDDAIKTGSIPEAKLGEVKLLRAEIAKLAAAKQAKQAQQVEEQAMGLLGYSKAWLRCGAGTFMWMKLPAKTS